MSEPIPESIPTSADPRSHRPTKRRALSPSSQHSASVSALFAQQHRDREIPLPASSTPKSKTLPAPPEIVANVQGSSAGAGSGEFHVYKASRRREYERLKLMDAEARTEVADREFAGRREEARRRDEERTGRNRARREKQKARKAKGKNGSGDAGEGKGGEERDGKEGGGGGAKDVKKKVVSRVVAAKREDGVEDEADEAMAGDGDTKAVEEVGITIHDED